MNNLWSTFVRWLAGNHIAYLEHENRELRFELQRWHDRYEGAIAAVRVFEMRNHYMLEAIADSQLLKPMEPIIVPKERTHEQ